MRLVEGRLTLTLTYIALGVGAFIALFPIALLVLNSLKPAPQIVAEPAVAARRADPLGELRPRLERRALQLRPSSTPILLSGLTIMLVCSTGSLTAYVLARQEDQVVEDLDLLSPRHDHRADPAFPVPALFRLRPARAHQQRGAVSLIYTALFSPFAVMLLRTYFLAVPRELEEAALVDGASHWQVFTMVMLPIVSPGILTVALIIGLYSWNEFLISTTFLQKADRLTAVVSFYLLSGQYTSDWGEIMAAALIIVLPVVVLFVLLQRRFIEGMAGGSVKG